MYLQQLDQISNESAFFVKVAKICSFERNSGLRGNHELSRILVVNKCHLFGFPN